MAGIAANAVDEQGGARVKRFVGEKPDAQIRCPAWFFKAVAVGIRHNAAMHTVERIE